MKLRLAVMVVALSLLLVVACSTDDPDPVEDSGDDERPESVEERSRGSIGVLWRDDVTVHPFLGWPQSSINPALSLAHPTLAKIDQSGEISAHLAEDIVFTGDREIAIRLPGTISWSDGQPLTADDVLFGLETLLHPDFSAAEPGDSLDFIRGARSYAAGETERISGVEITSDAELRVRLSYSTPRALLALSRLTPLPRHALEDVGAAGMGEALTDSSLPVAGAYHMVERVEEPESTLLHFERVEPTFEEADEEDDIADDARGPDDDMPDLIDYHFVENASTEGLDDLDMFYLPPGNSGALELPAESWTKTATVGADAVEYLGFNVQNEFLADPGVRRAVAYALDREEAVRLMFGERAVSSGQPLGALMGDFDGLQHVEYDPDRARELLKEAGYGEGAKRTPELYLLYPRDGSGRERLAETIAADLSEIGITLHPISADERSLLYTVFGRERYDMYLLALPLDTLLSPETWDEGGLLEYPGERPEPPSFEFMLYEPRSREHWRWLLSIIDDFPVAFLGYPRGEVYVRDGAPAFTPWRSPALGNIENWSGFLEEGN